MANSFLPNPLRSTRIGAAVLCIATLFTAFGCDQQSHVRVYVAPKNDTEFVSGPLAGGAMNSMAASSSSKKRILGAVIPMDSNCYFLKTTDSPERLDPLMEAFFDVVAKFSIDSTTGVPNGALPAGWLMRPRNDIAMAEYVAETSSGEVKFTVTQLGMPTGDDWSAYLLSNINRWRGQLNLPDLQIDSIKDELIEVQRDNSKKSAYIFDGVGTGSGAMSGSKPPFASAPNQPSSNPPSSKRAPDDETHSNVNKDSGKRSTKSKTDSPSSNEKPTTQLDQPRSDQPKLDYVLPDGWAAAESIPFRLATFSVKSDQGEGEATISLAVNNPEANTSMWFQQLVREAEPAKLAELSQKSISNAETISAAKSDATLYTIRASEQADEPVMFVAAMPFDGQGMHLFIKLRGETKLVHSEREHLLQFVKSLTWK